MIFRHSKQGIIISLISKFPLTRSRCDDIKVVYITYIGYKVAGQSGLIYIEGIM